MKFEKVIDGIVEYIEENIYKDMSDWQELLARVAVSRMIGNTDDLKKTFVTNPFIRTFAIVDSEGEVDVEGILTDIKEQLEKKDKVTIEMPLLGKFTFVPDDVDELYNTIRRKK